MSSSASKSTRIGRPRSETAGSHAAIMDAVYALLQDTSVRDLSMEAVAKRAGVSKPTLYKWWPSKAALVFAMFHERLAREPAAPTDETAEAAIRAKVRRLIGAFNELFGKVIAELIAEGQSDPAVLRELYEQHIRLRRNAGIADIERGKAHGEFARDVDSELVVDQIFGSIYYRMLLRIAPLTGEYGDKLVDQALRGLRPRASRARLPTARRA